MEKHEQPLIVPADSVQTQEETHSSLLEAWNDLQALPSYVEENARAVRQELPEDFAGWFLSEQLFRLLNKYA